MTQSLRPALLPLAATLLASFSLAQSPLTIGSIAVLRYGDGVAPLSNAAAAAFLEEWDPNGTFTTPVQPDIAAPTGAVGSNFACTGSGTANSEGQLNVSTNGFYLTWGGYDAAPGTLVVAQSANPPVARVIARLDILTGLIDTTTAITDAYSASGGANGNIRGVVSDNGTRFWTTSPVFSTTGGGVRYVANLGDLTSTLIAAGNIRHIDIYHDNLYVTQASGSVQGVAQVGASGLPISTESITLLNGFPTVANSASNYDMFWADPQTVYVADDAVNGAGGIQKWVNVAGTWTKVYTMALSATSGCRGVTGHVVGGQAQLWAIANSGSTTQIVTATDTVANTVGPAPTVTSLRTAPTNTAFRGIAFIGKPSTIQSVATSCGPARLIGTGNGEQNTKVFFEMRNTTGFASLIALDVTFSGIPLSFVFANCACTLGVSPAPVLLPNGPAFTLDLNPSWATLGLPIVAQGLDLFTPPGGPCPDLLDLTLTDTLTMTVQ
ncbi:MAG: hypothetical protein JNL08_16665 [Planctomycetes bacterium]|nr:hypothetical protein [Planctomycetota bacterium]